MTASPGVGKGKSRDEVMENLITLLANLNVTVNPARVEKNQEDLEKYQNKTEESMCIMDTNKLHLVYAHINMLLFLQNCRIVLYSGSSTVL